jgi:hypothetical protein
MQIFLSHVSKESELAKVLKKLLESTFRAQITVFISCDPENIPIGTEWLQKIRYALNRADLLLILCSPNSINSPWINFEAGCCWIKKVPIIPLCHSRLSVNNLPLFLSRLQSLCIETEEAQKILINQIAKYLEISNLPPLDYKAIADEILQSIDTLEYGENGKRIIDIGEDFEDNVEILKNLLLTMSTLGGKNINPKTISDINHLTLIKLEYYMGILQEKGYIDKTQFEDSHKYNISKKGMYYLVDHKLI